ncbi:MAG: N-acetylneuraminate synthase family protein [Spirochaetes bacterium]|nr:N-acetylneuraminate synthase family protein [Spirochaetota bacterium]
MKKNIKCRIIAEIASNHAGNMDLAKEFIRVSAEAGADGVKFQSSRYEDLVDKDDSLADWIKKTSLSDKDHSLLIDECKKHKVDFLTTCFSKSRINFLKTLGLKEIKVASPDVLSFSMLEELARHFDHLIISVGMHTINEIKKCIHFLEKNHIHATLLHATSLYPTPLEKAWMHKFLWLKENYARVGYSNHVNDVDVVKFSMDHGASIIETHLKLGENGPGRAKPWDLLPCQLKEIVQYRDKLAVMLGKEIKKNENWLDEEESQANKRFVGRWGDNR